jgi:hypothetical protein
MRSMFVKKYPFIGDRGEIPTTNPACINPVEGLAINSVMIDEPVDLVEGMKMANIRDKGVAIFINTDEDENLTITTLIPGKIQGYDAAPPTITVGPGEAMIVGPFNALYENIDGEIDFDFGGNSASAVCAAGRLP